MIRRLFAFSNVIFMISVKLTMKTKNTRQKRDVLIGEITKNRIGRENSIMDESL